MGPTRRRPVDRVHRRRRRRRRDDARGSDRRPAARASSRACASGGSPSSRAAGPQAASGGWSRRWCSCSSSSAPDSPCSARRCSPSRPTRSASAATSTPTATASQAVIDDLVGTPVLVADTQAAERELEAIPWVEEAQVTTHFPHGVTIEIRERAPRRDLPGSRRAVPGDRRATGGCSTCSTGQPIEYVLITGPDPVDRPAGEFAPAGLRRGRRAGQEPHRDGAAVESTSRSTSPPTARSSGCCSTTAPRCASARPATWSTKLVRLETVLDASR